MVKDERGEEKQLIMKRKRKINGGQWQRIEELRHKRPVDSGQMATSHKVQMRFKVECQKKKKRASLRERERERERRKESKQIQVDRYRTK
jgi:hypothetical protein